MAKGLTLMSIEHFDELNAELRRLQGAEARAVAAIREVLDLDADGVIALPPRTLNHLLAVAPEDDDTPPPPPSEA